MIKYIFIQNKRIQMNDVIPFDSYREELEFEKHESPPNHIWKIT